MRQRIPLPFVIAATALVVAGCSSNSTPDSPSSSVPGSQAASADPTGGPAATSMTFATNRGDITLATEPEEAPATVSSMTALAEQGYFDGTICHRLVTEGIYVLQCGDPTGTGTGGPGYTLPDENLPAAAKDNYPAGTVAMANAGPNTAGSQFFIVYEDTTLPPDYTIWGTVSDGLDVVEKIAKEGTSTGLPDGPPKQEVVIDSVSTS